MNEQMNKLKRRIDNYDDLENSDEVYSKDFLVDLYDIAKETFENISPFELAIVWYLRKCRKDLRKDLYYNLKNLYYDNVNGKLILDVKYNNDILKNIEEENQVKKQNFIREFSEFSTKNKELILSLMDAMVSSNRKS